MLMIELSSSVREVDHFPLRLLVGFLSRTRLLPDEPHGVSREVHRVSSQSEASASEMTTLLVATHL